MNEEPLLTFVERYARRGDELSCLLISREPPETLRNLTGDVRCRKDVSTAADLEGTGRYRLAVVAHQLGAMPRADAVQLIAQLRDRYAECTLIADTSGDFGLADFLALGFEAATDPAPAGWYIFDPDSGSRLRDWNNAENWANPENFKKFRW